MSVRRSSFALPLFLFAILLVAGCGADSPTRTDSPGATSRTAIGGGDVGDGPILLRAEGPVGATTEFLLRGENLRYESGALVVDAVIVNQGPDAVPLPATLSLSHIDPDTVTVEGADNGETGAGASFDLDFTDGDDTWAAGEESEARTLRFVVGQGVSVAFVARVDFEMSDVGGSIGGTVFEDLDEDGVFDTTELPIEGALIELRGNGIVPTAMRTAADGTYRFDGLTAGAYSVEKIPSPRSSLTTAPVVQVLLAEDEEGDVGDYLSADFGCIFEEVPPPMPRLEEGDFVEVTGRYDFDGYLVAYEIEREWDDDRHVGEARGPVTAVDAQTGMLAVMGIDFDVTGIEIHGGGPSDECQDRPALDFEVSDRARVRTDGMSMAATDTTDAVWDGARVSCWSGAPEKVYGNVEALEFGDDDRIVAFSVLGLRVEVNDRTDFDDDHDDDDDDDDEDEDDRS